LEPSKRVLAYLGYGRLKRKRLIANREAKEQGKMCRRLSLPAFRASLSFDASGAKAGTAAQISGALAAFPINGLRLNCCFLISLPNVAGVLVTETRVTVR
jgi:hypothetical protein